MPYYRWKGVDLDAQLRKGTQFSRNRQELDALLFRREVALIDARTAFILYGAPKDKNTIEYLRNISFLLRAGVLLPQALEIMAEQIDHPRFVSIVYDLSDMVSQGFSFSSALSKYPKVFHSQTIQLVEIGQEVGDLPAAIEVLTGYYDQRQEYAKKIKSAIAMPIVTIVFFFVLSFILLIGIVPQLAVLFNSFGKELPASTRLLLKVSSFLRSWYAVGTMICLGALGISFWQWVTTKNGSHFVSLFLLRVPLMRGLLIDIFLASYFQAISLLLKGGMQLVPALLIVDRSMSNNVVKSHVSRLCFLVEQGFSLSAAMNDGPSFVWSKEVKSLVVVGEESGMLSELLSKAGELHERRVQRVLTLVAMGIQPLILILLGLLIAGLVMVVYSPIMSLSYKLN